MSHDLFRDVVSPQVRVRSSSRYTIVVSIAAHALIVAAVVIAPLMATGALPAPAIDIVGFIPAQPMPPMPPAAQRPRQTDTPPANHDAAPTISPDKIRDEEPPSPPSTGETVIGSVDMGPSTLGLGPGDQPGLRLEEPPPPQPLAPEKPVRVGGVIRAPVKIQHLAPIYPQIAMSARVSGKVIIDAVIGTDGTVRDARVLSGVPLLNDAALTAVRQWRYTPTLLGGTPVQVIMTVTVNFQLQQ